MRRLRRGSALLWIATSTLRVRCRVAFLCGTVISGAFMGGGGYGYGATLPADEFRVYVEEQVDILAESGIDFFLIEHMWADTESRFIVVESAKATGLPVWVGFTATFSADGETVLMSQDEDRSSISGIANMMPTSGWRTIDHDSRFRKGCR